MCYVMPAKAGAHPVSRRFRWIPAFGPVDKPCTVRGRRPRLPISWCQAAHEDVHRPPSISSSTNPFAGMTGGKGVTDYTRLL